LLNVAARLSEILQQENCWKKCKRTSPRKAGFWWNRKDATPRRYI